MKKINILFIGQHFWADHLKKLSNIYCSDSIIACSEAFPPKGIKSSIRLIRLFLLSDSVVRVGLRPGKNNLKGWLVDLFCLILSKLNKSSEMFYYWIGSDVLNAIKDQNSNNVSWFFRNQFEKGHHIAGADILHKELIPLGIKSKVLIFPGVPLESSVVNDLPENFNVLSYIPDNRSDFYGGQCLYYAAQKLPNITFNIVGGVGKWIEQPLENLNFFGWQEDLSGFFKDATVVVRMVKHDAIGGTLRESMEYARHSIYSFEVPHTHHVNWGDCEKLVQVLFELESLHYQGDLKLNLDARNYALTEWNVEKLVRELVYEVS